MNYSIDQDLHEAESMVKNFAAYLRGSELYGSASGGFFNFGNMPSLTVGALVMRLRRLEALRDQMTPDQQQRLDSVRQQHDTVRKEWHAHYEKKVLREVDSRLNSIQQYFSDEHMDQLNAYAPEQLRRTIIQELLGVMNDLGLVSEELDKKLRYVDNRLGGIATIPGSFAWDSMLQPVYPQSEYWWLYRHPRA